MAKKRKSTAQQLVINSNCTHTVHNIFDTVTDHKERNDSIENFLDFYDTVNTQPDRKETTIKVYRTKENSKNEKAINSLPNNKINQLTHREHKKTSQPNKKGSHQNSDEIKSIEQTAKYLLLNNSFCDPGIVNSINTMLLYRIFDRDLSPYFYIPPRNIYTLMLKQNNHKTVKHKEQYGGFTEPLLNETLKSDTVTGSSNNSDCKKNTFSKIDETDVFNNNFNRYPYTCYSPLLESQFSDYNYSEDFGSFTDKSRYDHFLKNPIANLTNIFNRPYSEPPLSLIERIDSEHPNFESCEFKGTSRATTPIGFHPFLKEIKISEKHKNEFENEIEGYLNLNDGRKCDTYKTSMETHGSYRNMKVDRADNITKNKNTQRMHQQPAETKIVENESDNSFTAQNDKMANEIREQKRMFSVEQGDTINNSVFLSMDQEGSRFIQKRLEKSTKKEIQWFYYSIKSHLKVLCLDLFGNYVIQKIIDLKAINDDISLSIIPHVKELSLHMYGCRVIQKILDHENKEIMDIIKKNAVLLIEDQNGNHVIQKCVERSKDLGFLIEIYRAHTVKLCKHRYGCRVIQRLFEHCNNKEVVDIVHNLTKEIEMMMEDQYGNYVLQHVIENKPELRDVIIDSILSIGKRKSDEKGASLHSDLPKKDSVSFVDSKKVDTLVEKFELLSLENYDTSKLLHFCSHKFASNVIEKCVLYSPFFVDIFLRKVNSKPMVVCMAGDKFGNYVVQRVLDNRMIRNCLRQWCGDLKKSVYAKHILSKIQ